MEGFGLISHYTKHAYTRETFADTFFGKNNWWVQLYIVFSQRKVCMCFQCLGQHKRPLFSVKRRPLLEGLVSSFLNVLVQSGGVKLRVSAPHRVHFKRFHCTNEYSCSIFTGTHLVISSPLASTTVPPIVFLMTSYETKEGTYVTVPTKRELTYNTNFLCGQPYNYIPSPSFLQ